MASAGRADFFGGELSYRLIRYSSFPLVHDAVSEQRKLNVIRVLVGLVALLRTLAIAYTSGHYFPRPASSALAPDEAWLAWAEVALLVLFTVGFLTPLTTGLLLATYVQFDRLLGTSTLGTYVLVFLFATLLFSNCGAGLSIDGYLLHRHPVSRLTRAVRSLYTLVGFPDAKRLTVIYFCLFGAYAAISLGALLYHVQDVYWLTGHTVGVMLTNSYLCRYYSLFRWLEGSWPFVFRFISVTAVVFQTIYQALMLPLMFHKLGRYFVTLWGLVFFGISTVFLQLSYLPFLELLLWAILFWPAGLLFNRLTSGWPDSAVDHLTISSTWFGRLYPGAASLLILLFALGITPLRDAAPGLSAAFQYIDQSLQYVGLVAPNVFNRTDLKMGDRWPMIYRRVASQPPVPVPLNDREGGRRYYHLSDVLYFGNSLLWRRAVIEQDVAQFHQPDGYGRLLIERLIKFDYRLMGITGPVMYSIEIYENHSSDAQFADLQRKYEPRLILQLQASIEGRRDGDITARWADVARPEGLSP